MKILLIFLVAIVAFTSTFSGLLMITYPHGIISDFDDNIPQANGLRDLSILGLMFVLVGVVHMGAFFSLSQSREYQYNWSIVGGLSLIVSMLVTIILSTLYFTLEFFLAGAGVMITLLSLQLKGKWAA
jgi:hypothetical protein